MDSILDSLKGTGMAAKQASYKNPLAEKDYTLGSDKVKVTVVGVGGGGSNTVTRLSQLGIKSAETVAINTDMTHLRVTQATKRMLIGKNLTRGLGAGGFPEVAQKCAESNKDEIEKMLGGSELVFLTAGMGGGTGTGASPVVADVAKRNGAVVVGMVTYPFSLERARTDKAKWGIDQLSKTCDTVVVIDNNRLVQFAPNLPIKEAFNLADDIVAKAVKGISDTIMFPSLMNIDFADVRSAMTKGGVAMISMGEGKGNGKVQQAIDSTLSHPLLDVEYEGAKGALIHIAGGSELSLGDATKIGEGLTDQFDKNANVFFGARVMPELGDRVVITSIMTGVKSEMLHANSEQEKAAELAKQQSAMGLEEVTWR